MSVLQDFSLEDAIKAADILFGADPVMDSAQTMDELVEWIGESEVPRLVAKLDEGV